MNGIGFAKGPVGQLSDLVRERDYVPPAPLGGPPPDVDPATGIPRSAWNFSEVVSPSKPAFATEAPKPGPWGPAAPAAPKAPELEYAGDVAPTPKTQDIPTIPYNPPRGGRGAGGGPGGAIKEARAARLSSYDRAKEAEQKASEAKQEANAQQAVGLEQQQTAVMRAQADIDRINAEKKAYHETTMKGMQADIDEVANATIDPNHHLNSMSGKEKAQTNAALLLGSLGEAIVGGQSTAWQRLERNIDRDIDAQKTAMANKKAGLEAKRGLYALNMAKYGDEERTKLATKAMAIESIKLETERMAAASGSKLLQAQAEQKIAMLDEQKANVMTQFAEADQRRADAAAAAAASRSIDAIKGAKLDAERLVETRDSQGNVISAYAPDATSARALRPKLATNETITDGLSKIAAIAKANPNAVKNPMSEAALNIQNIRSGLLQRISTDAGSGVINGADEKRYTQLIGDPTTWDPTKGGVNQTENAIRAFKQERDSWLEQSNLQLVERQNAQTPGGIVPLAFQTGKMYKSSGVAVPKSAQEAGVKPMP